MPEPKIISASMMLAGNASFTNGFSNYNLAGNLCNAFAIGEIGAVDDFFLVGTPTTDEYIYPLLTGNFLDAEGNHLFSLVRNVLVVNPRKCSKIHGTQIGFEIHDATSADGSIGEPILKVATVYEGEQLVTRVTGNFYGKGGKKIATAANDMLIFHDGYKKAAIGYKDGAWFAACEGLSKEDLEIATLCVVSQGSIYQIVRGTIRDQEIDLDGKVLAGAHILDCKVTIRHGTFKLLSGSSIQGCNIDFQGPARQVAMLTGNLIADGRVKVSGQLCETAAVYSIHNHDVHPISRSFERKDEFPNCPECKVPVQWFRV